MICRQLMSLVRLSLLDLYRRKDLFVLLVLSLVLLVPLAQLEPFGEAGAGRYMSETAMLLIWVFSFAVTLGAASRLFPPEFESRTIYPLLAKPVSRGTVLLGKYFGALLTVFSALAVFYFLYALVHGLQGGDSFSPILLQGFVLHCGFVALVAAMVLLGSLVLTPSANLTIATIVVAGMFLFGRRLPEYAASRQGPASWLTGGIHAVAPHVEFFDMRQRIVHGWDMIPWHVCGLAVLYAVCYAAVCLWLAWLALRRRKL